ncbi:type IV pilin protein [Rhodoferax sp. TBRC 17198]|uniref:type IV pilin protein n=1 Tax=Rhodoferax potami TaxID=3068338 RepID=UPI0028BDE3C5|nr:type IV pilin protein [Rhodoferax sp. TBRC 17198]MDT7522282.1 type IV pilin protein [Rhodoferax sp. TBRC 17198]
MNFYKTKQKGFTLIELIIAVAIVGILVGIALPGYTEYSRRAARADAKNLLLSVAQRLEQNYTLSGRYDQTQDGVAIDDAMITIWGLNQSPTAGAARYNITFVANSLGNATYTLQATPAGSQVNDRCGVLALNERNLRASNGTDPNTAGVSRAAQTLDCWGR